MSFKLLVLGLFAALAVAATVLVLIKKNKIAEEYASIWISISVLTVLSVLFSQTLVEAYAFLKGEDGGGPEILLFGSLVVVVFFLLFISVKLSGHERAIVRLTQEIGLLRASLENRDKADPKSE